MNSEEPNMKSPMISIIIPTWNNKKDVLECLDSLSYLNYPNYEIIVVDNGSTDGTQEEIKKKFPEVRLIRSEKNLGVPGGRNLGIKNARGEYFFFLEEDVVVEPNVLNELLIVAQNDERIGIVCPKIYYYHNLNKIWLISDSVSLTTSRPNRVIGKVYDKGQFDQVMEINSSCILLVKRKVIESVGMYDPTFFALWDDRDFCLRVKRSGYKIMYNPRGKVWHKAMKPNKLSKYPKGLVNIGLSSPMRTYYTGRNRIIFMRKHARPLNLTIFLLFYLPIFTIYYTLRILRFGRIDFLKSYWKGTISGLIYTFRRENSSKKLIF